MVSSIHNLMLTVYTELYCFKYSYLILIINKQLYGFKYSYQILIIHIELNGFKYSQSNTYTLQRVQLVITDGTVESIKE